MRIRTLAVVAALLCPVALSCGKEKITETVVPDAGLTLRYDLTPGQTYAGAIKSRTTIPTPMGELSIRMEFAVDLIVTGTTTADGPLISATFKDIQPNIVAPAGIPPAMVGFDPAIAKGLNGMELRFNMTDEGEIENMPELPETEAPEVIAIVGQLTNALESSLPTLPADSLKKGESWTKSRDEDGAKSETTGTLKSFGTAANGSAMAEIESETQGSVKRKVQEQDVEGTFSGLSTLVFASEDGYVASVTRKLRQSTNLADVNIEIDAEWSKGAKQAVEASAPEVQSVSDPCDADYVGGEECPADAAAGEVQAITDPCDADYVGGEECPADAPPAE